MSKNVVTCLVLEIKLNLKKFAIMVKVILMCLPVKTNQEVHIYNIWALQYMHNYLLDAAHKVIRTTTKHNVPPIITGGT